MVLVAAVVVVVVAVCAVAAVVATVAVIGARRPTAAPGALRAQCARHPAVTHSATVFGVRSRAAGALLLLAS